jgi:hypothetical protein
VNLPSDTIDEFVPEIYTEKTKYMLISHYQKAGQNQDIETANRMFENMHTVKISGNDSNKSKFDSGGNGD